MSAIGKAAATVRIVPRQSAEGHPFTDIFVQHEGRTFHTRQPWPVPDSEHERAYQKQQFLERRRRVPA